MREDDREKNGRFTRRRLPRNPHDGLRMRERHTVTHPPAPPPPPFLYPRPHRQTLWAKSFGGSGFYSAQSCTLDTLGNVYVCGSASGQLIVGGQTYTVPADQTPFVAKFNKTGGSLWVSFFTIVTDASHFEAAGGCRSVAATTTGTCG